MADKELQNRIDRLENLLEGIYNLLQDVFKHGALALSAPALVPPPCPYTFHSWLDEWLNVYKKPHVKASTLCPLEVAIRIHIKPNFFDIALDLVTGLDLQKMLIGITKSRTRKTVVEVLNSSLRIAKDLKLIFDNPMSAVKIPAHKHKSYPAIQPRSQNMLLFKIENEKYLALFWYCCCTGMRITEAIESIPFIDFSRCVIYVQGEDTTTKKHKRIIEFLPELITPSRLALLKQITVSSAQSYFKRLFKKLNLNFVTHSFRHTFASCCHHVKIDDKWTQTRLGHSGIEMTMDVYVDLLEDINTPILDYFRKLKAVYSL